MILPVTGEEGVEERYQRQRVGGIGEQCEVGAVLVFGQDLQVCIAFRGKASQEVWDGSLDLFRIHLFRLRQDKRAVLPGKEYAGDGVVGKEGIGFPVRVGEKLHVVLLFPEIGRHLLLCFAAGDQEHTDGGIVFIYII